MGSSVYCRIFFKPVKDASLKALLMSEIATSFFEFIVISVSEPLGTGTLIPHPPITVFNSGNNHSCIFDSEMTSVIGKMIKIIGWYDNEVGYSSRLIDLILLMSKKTIQ